MNRDDFVPLEYWAPVRGYEGRYSVSSCGRIRSHARHRTLGRNSIAMQEREMKQLVHMKGYSVVWLRRPGEHVKHFVHRLVADAFIPNPEAKLVVNHMDRNKLHNHRSNLEWVSFKENTAHWMADDKPVFLSADLPF